MLLDSVWLNESGSLCSEESLAYKTPIVLTIISLAATPESSETLKYRLAELAYLSDIGLLVMRCISPLCYAVVVAREVAEKPYND